MPPDPESPVRGRPWTPAELEFIVADYLEMLRLECIGNAFSKTEHRAELMSRLPGRSNGSVEYKHQNISAVMIALGLPWVAGYKPARNVQHALIDEVVRQAAACPWLRSPAASTSIVEAVPGVGSTEFDAHPDRTRVPNLSHLLESVSPQLRAAAGRLARIDWFAREQQMRTLGEAGERYVLDFERARLRRLGRADLAGRIEWTSRERGDGAGYDIQSYDMDGRDRLVEVKTTRFGAYAPFFVTTNELEVSRSTPEHYWLYRVHSFQSHARICAFPGVIEGYCSLHPSLYRAQLRA
ncbi:MAG: DUF3883 domain-containing protein [Phycisphaeraceae bacterium]|nr:DUF3883 domain-containing protein [Phycisphaeraceae bacterium]